MLRIKDNQCELAPMTGTVSQEVPSTVEAKTYAESITILNSTENKAPELVYEEDEMDEDGDEDDDIDNDLNIFTLFNKHTVTSFFCLRSSNYK